MKSPQNIQGWLLSIYPQREDIESTLRLILEYLYKKTLLGLHQEVKAWLILESINHFAICWESQRIAYQDKGSIYAVGWDRRRQDLHQGEEEIMDFVLDGFDHIIYVLSSKIMCIKDLRDNSIIYQKKVKGFNNCYLKLDKKISTLYFKESREVIASLNLKILREKELRTAEEIEEGKFDCFSGLIKPRN